MTSDHVANRYDSPAEVTAQISRVVETHQGLVLIGIDGHSGSGKSTFAQTLALRFSLTGRTVQIIEVEDFIGGWLGLTRDISRVSALVQQLAERGWAQGQPWDWYESRWAEPVRIPQSGQSDVVLLVGCGSTSLPIQPYLDLTVWLDAPETLRQRRVRERDPYDWGEHWEEWARQEKELLAQFPSDRQATFILRPGEA